MVLPLSLLKSSQNQTMLIELKNGDSYIGQLCGCDSWMNIHLKDATFTSKDGDKFFKVPEVYVRGPTIKLMRIPEEVMMAVNDEVVEVRRQQQQQHHMRNNRFQRGQGAPRGRGNYTNSRGGANFRQFNNQNQRPQRGGHGGGNYYNGGYQRDRY
ncbi:hypothetical protein FO519_003245 [Halicephalobus sp. NKZ332]|nr:hypothetical protein FO519_003245 [Halicephalobus sp. NKZ332]